MIGNDLDHQDIFNEDDYVGQLLYEVMTGDKTAENFEAGSRGDLESHTKCATVAVENDRSIPSTLNNKPTTSFQPLTEDISKYPDLATMLHGFIIKAQQVLCDSNPSHKKGFLQLFFANASDLMQPIQDITYASKKSPNTQTDSPLHLFSIIRPQTIGQLKTKQYQSLNESITKASNKSRNSNKTPLYQLDKDVFHVNAKEKRQYRYCSFCSGCKLISETGYLLKIMEVDKFHIKLTHHDYDIKLGMFTITDNCTKLTQIPPKKFLCVHGYDRVEQDRALC